MKHVLYAATERGYAVLVLNGDNIVERYDAGNHVRDSQTYVDPGSNNALTEADLLAFAKRTANETAAKHGTTTVEYDDDLEAQLREEDAARLMS